MKFARDLGRRTKLLRKFKYMEVEPGQVLMVGITERQHIHWAARGAGRKIRVDRTGNMTQRDDGVLVPIFKVTFQ
jgi:hypothetical protein